MKIKEKVLKTLGIKPKFSNFNKTKVEKAVELTLHEVSKVIDESFLKDMNDSGCSCGSFFNFIEGKFICNGCREECENKFYEELKKGLGI